MRLPRVIGCSLSAIMLACAIGSAQAEEEKPLSATASVGYFSKYVWRGQNVNDSSVLQPNISGSAYGFTGSIWANVDLTNDARVAPDNAGEFSEIDYTLDYSRGVPGTSKVGFSLGVIHYLFPNTAAKSTTEVYGALSFAVPLSPKIYWYRDVNAIDGSYMQVAAGHTFNKVAKWNDDYHVGVSVNGSIGWAGAGYNKGYFGVDETKFNDLALSIGVPFTLKSFTLTPSVNVTSMVDSRIGDAVWNRERNNVWFGVGFSKSF